MKGGIDGEWMDEFIKKRTDSEWMDGRMNKLINELLAFKANEYI